MELFRIRLNNLCAICSTSGPLNWEKLPRRYKSRYDNILAAALLLYMYKHQFRTWINIKASTEHKCITNSINCNLSLFHDFYGAAVTSVLQEESPSYVKECTNSRKDLKLGRKFENPHWILKLNLANINNPPQNHHISHKNASLPNI